MTKVEIVNALLNALEDCRFEDAAQYLCGDFVFAGPVPIPLTGREWLELHKRVAKTFSNWRFVRSGLVEERNNVRFKLQFSGTHDGLLDYPEYGYSGVAPTLKHFLTEEEDAVMRVEKDKVQSFHVTANHGNGVEQIVKQLGLDHLSSAA